MEQKFKKQIVDGSETIEQLAKKICGYGYFAYENDDRNAILSHQANHPHTLHFTEDIRTLELSPMVSHLQKMKAEYPKVRVVPRDSFQPCQHRSPIL